MTCFQVADYASTKRLNDGRIPSVIKRDQALECWKLLNEYVDKDGDVSRATLHKFEDERLEVVARVFWETDVLFITCNNAGSEIVKTCYDPKVGHIDETGQLTMAGIANVLTSFPNMEGLTIWGDPNQLLPFNSNRNANEFSENAELSVLALLEEKNYPIFRLDLQYRMAPAIVEWPAKFFYKGLLKNHPSVLVDTEYRKAARDISINEYKRKGPNGNGSEYWMINVANGVSRAQDNGTSLQNHANANRIANLVDQSLIRGVPASKITVLSYYTGQLSLTVHKIEETAKANERNWDFKPSYQISSVDSFQGEENEFVFVELVVAHQQALRPAAAADAEDSGEEDDGSENFKRSGRVTAHVRSANRLCCALTRGRSCVVVVGQLHALLGTSKALQPRVNAAISLMAKDFMDRGLVYHDHDTLDTSADGEATRKKWDAAKLEGEMRKKKAESLTILSINKKKVDEARYTDDFQVKSPMVYHTSSRRTTRPNQSGDVAKVAENHDAQQQNRSTLSTDAGPVTLNVAGGTQRRKKEGRWRQRRRQLGIMQLRRLGLNWPRRKARRQRVKARRLRVRRLRVGRRLIRVSPLV